uniref:Ubiquitin-like protease family profile domain-containing protein n=1 Tax=Lactuca sativa TaxID=4236 RepID=A0A9R1UH94_LACSA|nr:hypothetical protein LSAT_V11C900505150 [Lactuca sativa]
MLPAVRACGFVLRKNRDMPRMKRWSGTKKLKWVDVNKIFSKTQGQPPRNRTSLSDDEMTSCYYMSFKEYVYGEQKSVSSPMRDHFRTQDESSSSGRSHGRGGRSGKPSLKELFMNREPTEVFVEEVNNEDLWNNISFEEPKVFQTNFDEPVVDKEGMIKIIQMKMFLELEERNDNARCSRNKFDSDVFDANDYNEAKELHPINRGLENHHIAHGTEAKKRQKKKVDIKSTNLVPPPAFAVVHDFSVLRLQPYVAGCEVVIHNYLFHSYDVQHRLINFVLHRDFWSALFGHTHDGWLESSHITIWYRLLMERRFDGDRHTIMPPNFFVCHAVEEGQDWRAFMAGIATYPNFMVAWWDVDTVILSIHSSPNHWLFGELRLASMEVHIYDSLGRGAYKKFNSDGTFTKFESRVENYLEKINYWVRRNIPRIPLNMQFILEKNVSQQSSHLGDCGVFVCMFMEQLVSGQPIRELIDPRNATLEFRQRMAKIYWGSSLGPM